MEVIHHDNQQLAEGPLWFAGNLYWVDIKANNLHRLEIDTNQHHARHFPEQLTSISTTNRGDFIVTTRHGISILQGFEGELEKMVDIEGHKPTNRFNDAKIDPHGNLWAGTMDDGETAATGSLYRIDSEFKVTMEDTGYFITNGPTFSPDGRFLYHTDSAIKKVYRFQLSETGITNKQTFINLGSEHGHPDGMTVDEAGNIWICEYGGWGISKFSAEGSFLTKIPLPVSNVTSCTFGGENSDILFITTAAKGLSQSEFNAQPLAGSIFKTKLDTKGLPANLFKY